VSQVARLVLGIAGGSGSGKTTLSRSLVEVLAPCPLIDHDSYYREQSDTPLAVREKVNYDHPSTLDNDLLCAHLDAFRRGEGFEKPRYDFPTHSRATPGEPIAPGHLAIVEGILVLAHAGVRARLDFSIFVATPERERRARRLARDVAERGREPQHVEWQFANHVQPMHARHVEPSAQHADLQLSGLSAPRANLERVLDALVAHRAALSACGRGTGGRLLSYGTLVPGAENHGQVADLGGSWETVFVRGHRSEVGFGTGRRYPGFAPDPDGPRCAMQLLRSPALPAAWARLDAFEGAAYERRLALAEDSSGAATAAWIYVPVSR